MKRRVREVEKVGELQLVPYLDIMVNLTMFMLVSMTSMIQFAVLNVSVPSYGPSPTTQVAQPDKPKKQLLLNVAISVKGFYIAGSGGVLAGSPDQPADPKSAPPTIPLKAGPECAGPSPATSCYDYVSLTKHMVDIKSKFPDENKVILTADQTIAYDVLIKTMDAVREDGPHALFYNVMLGAM